MVADQHEHGGVSQRTQTGRESDLRRLVYDTNIKGTPGVSCVWIRNKKVVKFLT